MPVGTVSNRAINDSRFALCVVPAHRACRQVVLFHAVRVGWAMTARIHVMNASAAVRSGLDYLESYALK